jgi:hypothetical protein
MVEAGLADCGGVQRSPEVRKLHHPLLPQQQVGCLDVAVHHAAVVQVR